MFILNEDFENSQSYSERETTKIAEGAARVSVLHFNVEAVRKIKDQI